MNGEKGRRIFEGIVFLILSIFLLISLVNFNPQRLSFLYAPALETSGPTGKAGDVAGFILYFFVGWGSYSVIFSLLLFSLWKLRGRKMERIFPLSMFAFVFSSSLLFSFFRIPTGKWGGIFAGRDFSGGMVGYLIFSLLHPWLGKVGTPFVGFLLFLWGILSLTGYRFPTLKWGLLRRRVIPSVKEVKKIPKERKEKRIREKRVKETIQEEVLEEEEILELPPLSLLNDPPPEEKEDDTFLKENAKRLEEVLSQFGVEARVVDIHKGPVITSYELKPGAGVKVHQITALADDIALALKSPSVRIVTPIPGKAVIGIEIPNPKPRFVYLKEVLSTPLYRDSLSPLTLALGKDIRGNPLVGDLKEMPHLLIAGTTGSGKTVCLHSLIMSILFKSTPDEVKMIIIDPKMVELSPFSAIPHLYTPIVTRSKEAAKVLQWMVEIMEERYSILAETGVRDVEKFNRKMEREGKEEEKMPYMVVIIDELADLMAVASREVEDSIMRLAQLSRAAGIHLILATQRPSVDVITGVIKANFPCRISFKVSSKVDSRTILDTVGAEKLLGKGDMLYLPPGGRELIRVQGCLVSEEEIERVVEYLSRYPKKEPQHPPLQIIEKVEKEELPAEDDPLFKEAVRVVLTSGQASASHLQRRMRIGYARAGRLIDLMEKKGIVGPARGSKPREILVDISYLDELEKEEKS